MIVLCNQVEHCSGLVTFDEFYTDTVHFQDLIDKMEQSEVQWELWTANQQPGCLIFTGLVAHAVAQVIIL